MKKILSTLILFSILLVACSSKIPATVTPVPTSTAVTVESSPAIVTSDGTITPVPTEVTPAPGELDPNLVGEGAKIAEVVGVNDKPLEWYKTVVMVDQDTAYRVYVADKLLKENPDPNPDTLNLLSLYVGSGNGNDPAIRSLYFKTNFKDSSIVAKPSKDNFADSSTNPLIRKDWWLVQEEMKTQMNGDWKGKILWMENSNQLAGTDKVFFTRTPVAIVQDYGKVLSGQIGFPIMQGYDFYQCVSIPIESWAGGKSDLAVNCMQSWARFATKVETYPSIIVGFNGTPKSMTTQLFPDAEVVQSPLFTPQEESELFANTPTSKEAVLAQYKAVVDALAKHGDLFYYFVSGTSQ